MLSLNKIVSFILILLLDFGFYESKSQNLIGNSGFEQYNPPINWSTGGGGFFDHSYFPAQRTVLNWDEYNSPDYFSSVDNNIYRGVPINDFGISYPKDGVAYAGFITFIKAGETKEYIGQQLSASLKQDSVYCLSFFVSRADRVTYAIKNIGAYFSPAPPPMTDVYLNHTPQIVNTNGFITDTIGWTEIQGCFTAQGGEQYITIGNFNSNANTDTLFVGSINPNPGANGYAYYYVDSVSLWKNNFPTGVHEMGKAGKFMLYPNPNNGLMYLTYELSKKAELVMTDITGRLVSTSILDETQRSIVIKEQELSAGIYFYTIKQNQQILKQEKIVIIK